MTQKRILLVDYDPRNLNQSRQLLEKSGFAVSTCTDGLSALEQFKSLAPDLVLLSAMLPKMHGFEVCSNIRKTSGGEKTPVVIITDVYKGKRYRVDAINKYGATEYIEKPIEDEKLISILTQLVGGQVAAQEEDLADRTVQIQKEELLRQIPKAEAPATSEKKAVTEKPRSKDQISKKLEESLAGLELNISKARPKPKPAEPKPSSAQSGVKPPAEGETAQPTVIIEKPPAAAPNLTAEDLFTDVIASVERELESQKIITRSGVAAADKPIEGQQESAAPTILIQPQKPAAPADTGAFPAEKTEPKLPETPKPEPQKAAEQPRQERKGGFDAELEKKLSSTLSGLMKEKPKAASPKGAKPPAQPKKPEVPAPQPVQAAPPKPEPAPVQPPAPVPPAPQAQRSAEAAPPKAAEPVAAARSAAVPTPVPAAVQAPAVQPPIPIAVPATPAKPAPAIAEKGLNFGQYLLLEKIATGGMAELFKAKRKGVEGFEKILAIKRILPHMSDNEEFITMFIDEAKLAAQLTHHNICQIFDLGKIEASYYIAMEYVHGKDLRAVLKASRLKDRPFPVELAVLVTSKLCGALDYAHRKRDANGQPLNLVHRDVSPQNILLSYEGDVKLVDFGIAKATTKVHVTQHGALKGKLLYMSPEQAWGRSTDKRTDIFSVGIVLHEMLTGRPLFFEENDTEVTILEKVREAKIVPVRELNPKVSLELQRIMEKALKKNPEDRYQVASEMQKDLDNLFYSEGYNATSANLANFVRSLFPEEWGMETGVKETVVLDKAASEALKASVEAAPAAGHVGAAVAGRPAPAPQPAPVAPKRTEMPAEEKKAAAPAKTPEAKPDTAPAKKQAPAAEPAPAAAGFRDISMPEIMVEQEKSNIGKLIAGIALIAIAVGVVAFLLFRPKPQPAPVAQPPKKIEQPAPAQQTPQQQPAPVAQAPAQQPNAAALDQQKADLQKKVAEEQKKLDQMKAEEEKKKQDEAKQAEEARLKAEAASQQEAQQPPPQQVAQAQPAQQPVQEQPKPEPPKEEAPQVTQPPPEQKPAPPAEPAVKEGDLVELTPDVIRPAIITKVDPEYPPVARRNKVEGTVILSALVNERGQVAEVRILRGAGGSAGLNEAAVAALKKWKFQPAVKAGKRVKVWMTYPLAFRVQ